jgi:uncharacterized membrane protein YeaQ/YmgE (transglycosylase-associated protein family)
MTPVWVEQKSWWATPVPAFCGVAQGFQRRGGHGVCRTAAGPFGLSLNLNRSNFMINLIVWLVVGGVIGWLASLIMRTDAQQGIFLNVIVGIIGAALGGWLISPLVGVGSINDDAFSIGALLVSLVGAVILLAIVNLFRRGSPR